MQKKQSLYSKVFNLRDLSHTDPGHSYSVIPLKRIITYAGKHNCANKVYNPRILVSDNEFVPVLTETGTSSNSTSIPCVGNMPLHTKFWKKPKQIEN